jgi:hypothetical protein
MKGLGYVLYKPLKATFEFGIQIQDVKTHESYCLLCSLFADMFTDLKSLSLRTRLFFNSIQVKHWSVVRDV